MAKKIKLCLILFSICTAVLLYGVFAPQPSRFEHITNYPPQGQTIVAFGDSLTSGFGSTNGNNYVTLLSHKLGVPIVNKGVPGDTSAQALKRIDDVLALKPDVVIVYLGGNDFLQKVSSDTTFMNLEKIVSLLQENGAVVVLVGIRGGVLRDQYGPRFKELSTRYNTVYVPDMLIDVMAIKDAMYDAVHPNNRGYAYIADVLYKHVEGMVKKTTNAH